MEHTRRLFDKLSDEYMGGIRGGEGYNHQAAYICLRAVDFIQQDNFVALEPEGFEDLDVKFIEKGKVLFEMHQVKKYPLKPSELKNILSRFKKRNDQAGNSAYQRLVISAPSFSPEVTSLKNALKRYNDSFHVEIPQVSRETRETLEKRLKDYQGYEEILINQVEFFDDWSGMVTPQNQVEWIALRLQKSNLFHHLPFDILERATVQLIYYVQHVLYHSWSKDELLSILHQVVDFFCRPGLIPSSDFILVHQWSADITGEISFDRPQKAAAAFKGERGKNLIFRQVTLSFKGSKGFPATAEELIQQMTAPRGQLKRTLDEYPAAEVALMGVIEIPFGFLVAYLISDGRKLYIFEHDRDKAEYFWDQGDSHGHQELELDKVIKDIQGSEAIMRLSFSGKVWPEACETWLAQPAADYHLRLPEPGKDLITSSEQAREYAVKFRKAYENLKNSMPNLHHLHLFLAAPMSLVYWIGRIFKSNDMPPKVTVYHYQNGNYEWGLEISAAANRYDPELYKIVFPRKEEHNNNV